MLTHNSLVSSLAFPFFFPSAFKFNRQAWKEKSNTIKFNGFKSASIQKRKEWKNIHKNVHRSEFEWLWVENLKWAIKIGWWLGQKEKKTQNIFHEMKWTWIEKAFLLFKLFFYRIRCEYDDMLGAILPTFF